MFHKRFTNSRQAIDPNEQGENPEEVGPDSIWHFERGIIEVLELVESRRNPFVRPILSQVGNGNVLLWLVVESMLASAFV